MLRDIVNTYSLLEQKQNITLEISCFACITYIISEIKKHILGFKYTEAILKLKNTFLNPS